MHHEQCTHIVLLYSFPDDTVFHRIPIVCVTGTTSTRALKIRAILLFLGEDPSSTTNVDIERYTVTLVYRDIRGDKSMIFSDPDLADAGRQFTKEGEVKIFASVEIKKDEQESPTLESAAESSIQADHSATFIANPSPFIIKLALADSGGKKVVCSASLMHLGGRNVSLP
jgi:hypothetical protein